jgi:hypothetical protein
LCLSLLASLGCDLDWFAGTAAPCTYLIANSEPDDSKEEFLVKMMVVNEMALALVGT